MNIIVGIDTGVNTGLAVRDCGSKSFLSVETVKIHRAMDVVRQLDASNPGGVLVLMEDARQRKWIPKEVSWSQAKGRAMGAGSVKRDSGIWEDFLKDTGIRCIAVAPKDNATKLSAEVFSALTGWKGRTSEHGRDAAMLVHRYVALQTFGSHER